MGRGLRSTLAVYDDYFSYSQKELNEIICSNCHKELHDNMWTIEELNLEEMEEVEPNGIN